MARYQTSDISVIIATYNREEDLYLTIKSFEKNIPKLKEILIIDQSPNNKTEKTIKKFRYSNLKYFHSNKPSLTLARNFGINKSSKTSKILLFLDDDVSLGTDYFNEIINVFNKENKAIGVAGHYFPQKKTMNKFTNLVRRFFFIEHWKDNDASVLSAYGSCYPPKLSKTINASWIPGFNMAFKKEIFLKDKFDENFFRYGLGEDFEFTTRINNMYPRSLYITPFASIIHRVSEIERMPKPKLAYMNHVNHLYIQRKNFNNLKGVLSTTIALITISLMHIFQTILKPNQKNKAKCLLHFKALYYCIKRFDLIRKGNLEIPVSQ